MVELGRLKLAVAAALAVFAVVPSNAFADSVSVSTSVSTEFRMEIINSEPNVVRYSGIIIDCRKLGLQTAASPVIKAESGTIIYGDKDLDFDKINEIGMAAYVTLKEESVARVGINPLVVKAVSLDKFNTCPVLSDRDAGEVIKADRTSGFFKDLKVVFWTD